MFFWFFRMHFMMEFYSAMPEHKYASDFSVFMK